MDRTEANTGTRDVTERLRFDEAALSRWMQEHVEGFRGPLTVSQFKGGQSNPTYRLDAASGASQVSVCEDTAAPGRRPAHQHTQCSSLTSCRRFALPALGGAVRGPGSQ